MDDQLGSSNDVKNRVVNGEEDLCDEFDFNETNTDDSWDEEDKEEEEDEDDRMFDENVCLNDELVGLEGTNATGRTDFDSDTGSIDLAASDDELESLNDSDEECSKEDRTRFNPQKNMDDPDLFCGLTFSDIKEFKEAVRNYSIKRGRPIEFTKTDKVRCRAKCKNAKCEWYVYARMMQPMGRAEIRSFESKHSCSFSSRNSNVKSGWLARKYMPDFILEPNPNMHNFTKKVIRDTRCRISKSTVYRARKKALEKIRGSQVDQYCLVQAYIEEIKRSDPEATMILQTTSAERIEDGDNIGSGHQFAQRFFRLYCCFSALKKGMLAGCRKIFGIDGCHLRGENEGMLLAAVGIDPNNNLFPIAYAVTEGENTDSWIWFLDLLRKDLLIENDFEWTIISDKQKGLIQACDAIFPNSDHRFCIRHMHANWVSAGYTGGILKAAFYQAALATTNHAFEQAMALIKGLSPKAHEWLEQRPPRQWSRSHFESSCKCDMLLNNLCESFNGRIRDAREMPILSMFESIRNFLMVRFQENRDMAKNKWRDKKICPRIKEKLDKNIELSADCIPYKCDDNKYECHQFDGMQYIVHLKDMVCSCRRWQLTGIPCSHACAAISATGAEPEVYVAECYMVDTYKKVYELAVQPVCGINQLSSTVEQTMLPPVISKKAGRPKKVRKKSQGEAELSRLKKDNGKRRDTKKMSRAGLTWKCGHCGKPGHNIRKCPDMMKATGERDVGQPVCTLFDESQESISMSTVTQEEAEGSNQGHRPRKLPVQRKGIAATVANQGGTTEAVRSVLGKRIGTGNGIARQNKKVTSSSGNQPVASQLGNLQADYTVGVNTIGTSSSGNQPVSSQLGNVHAILAPRPITTSVEKQTDDTLGVNTTVLEKPLTGIKKLFMDVDVERGPTGAPLTYPYYRRCPTTGSMVPNFHFRNGAHYLPISCIKKALEQKNKPPNED